MRKAFAPGEPRTEAGDVLSQTTKLRHARDGNEKKTGDVAHRSRTGPSSETYRYLMNASLMHLLRRPQRAYSYLAA
jgi:hypothetical protein